MHCRESQTRRRPFDAAAGAGGAAGLPTRRSSPTRSQDENATDDQQHQVRCDLTADQEIAHTSRRTSVLRIPEGAARRHSPDGSFHWLVRQRLAGNHLD
jgi:hypothetical protein